MGREKAAISLKKLVGRLQKIELRYYLSFLLALALLFSGALLLALGRSAALSKRTMVQDGRLDLTAVLLDDKNLVELAGEFFFYPDLLVEGPGPDGAELVPVPGVWNDYYGQESASAGFGTYRLLVELPEPGLYAVRSKTIRAAARIYLNGRLAAQLGQPAQSMADFVPESRYLFGFVQAEDSQLELVIQVANYGYGKGGILKPLEFGSARALLARQRRELALELTMVVLFLSLAFFALVIYLWRGRQPALLFFCLASVFLALYLATMNNQVLSILFAYSFFTRLKIQISSMVLSALCFLFFVRSFFPRQTSYRICRVWQGLLILALLLGFNDPRWAVSLPLELVQFLVVIILALVYGYITWCLFKALWQKASASEYLLVVLAAVCTYWLLLFGKILFELDLAHLPEIYLFIGQLGAILLIGDRLHKEYLLATRLTEERLEQELKYFFAQISPHFLYNTINTIIALSYEDAAKTRQALNNLALYFRGKLELHLQKGLIPLERELDMVRAYLEIEKLRHAKLAIELDIDENLKAQIPPLTIQPLAENAIRHGIMPQAAGGTVRVLVKRKIAGLINICVEDDGAGISKERQREILDGEADGLGLGNVLQKLKLMPKAEVRLESEPGQGTRIRILLPEEDGDESCSD